MIEADDVHKAFQSGDETVEALRGVSFALPDGSSTFIVGPSGSGKSTLLYLLGALDRPTSGTIRVDGQDLTTMTEAEQDAYRRDQVGFVFQSFNLIQNLSAVDNVLLPYIPHGATPELPRRRPTCSCGSGWATGCVTGRRNSPAASNSGSRSPGRSSRTPC